MTDYVKLRETIERGGAAKYHEAAAGRGKLFARERIVGRELPSQVLRAGPRTRTVAP